MPGPASVISSCATLAGILALLGLCLCFKQQKKKKKKKNQRVGHGPSIITISMGLILTVLGLVFSLLQTIDTDSH